MLTHLLTTESVSKLLDCDRKIQNDVHIDTYFGKPEPISWRYINMTVFYTSFFCPLLTRNVRSRRRIDSSSIIAHPVNFERSLKCDAKNSTYIYIRPLDNRYRFSISVQLKLIAPLFTFLFEKENVFLQFSKLTGLWLVGVVVNDVWIYGSKVAGGLSAFQRRSCWA